jgi:two-component system chemotaxis sensor kinase CheA
MERQVPPSRWFYSVGTRLALATALLVLLVAGALYYALTRYQRQSLLKAKSDAALMMVELFAELSSAPLLFADDQGVRDSVSYLRSNAEVLEAAVFVRQPDGALASPLARLTRDAASGPLLSAPLARDVGSLRLSSHSLEVSHWVRGPSGQAIGAVSVRLSLARENRSSALLARRTLQISCAIALGVLLLLLLLARVYIIAPLRAVHGAVQVLSSGGQMSSISVRELSLAKRDEIGDLARGFLGMADAIARREASIAQQNSEMRLVLSSVGQGFLVLDAEGRIEGQHSAILEQWFGKVPHGTTLWSYLSRGDPEQAEWLSLAWSNIGAPYMPIELCLAQMPRSFSVGTRHYEFEYRPLLSAPDQLEKMVVVISDVSELREREAAEREQRELVMVFSELIRDRTGFAGCSADAAALVDAIRAGATGAQALLEQLHTLKGNAWLFHLRELAESCELIEARCATEGRGPSVEEAGSLARALANSTRLLQPFMALDAARAVSLRSEDFLAIEQALRAGESNSAVLLRLVRASAEPAAQVFTRFLAQLEPLARRLGKCPIEAVVEDGGVRFPRARFAPLWTAMVHALRNVADHGLETPWQREQCQKPPRARVTLGAECDGSRLYIRLRDDGRGVKWDEVREKAERMGLPADTRAELTYALLHHGFSTLEAPSELSGRGVGLSALLREVEQLGGELRFTSEQGLGSELTIELPSSLVVV